MDECKFYFGELVYVDFGDHKIIGKVQSHRISDAGTILYNVSGAGLYVPPTMVHKLTEEQEVAYFELLKKYDGVNKAEVFTEEMQEIFKLVFNDFYKAWWFLNNHPMFANEFGTSSFQSCLDIYIAKVNPKTCEIDEDSKLNTKVEVWVEAGKYDKNTEWHDYDLDCGGDTYEEAIINLANGVLDQYGRDSKERIK